MAYTENNWQGNPYRKEYLDGINNLLENLRSKADEKRNDFRKDIFKDSEKYRKAFKDMLGYPLNTAFDYADIPNCKKTFLAKEGEYSIYRMQIEVLPDLWFYGIYFVKEDNKARPLVICQHGGGGISEVITSILPSQIYNDVARRAMKYDVNLFAPQLLLWQINEYGINYDRKQIDQSLKQVGSSITALEVYSIMKSINYFSSQKETNTDKIGMIGLSYGGFYTIFTTACDTRIKAALSSSFYNNRYIHGWSDWLWNESGEKFLDNEAVMLAHPRYIHIAVGTEDEMFAADDAKAEFEKMKAFCKDDTSWIDFTVFEGRHEFPKQEEPVAEFMKHLLAD